MVVSNPLEPEHAVEVFSVIEPFIDDLCERFGGDPSPDIKESLANGKYKLHSFGNEGFIITHLEDAELHIVTAYAFTGSLKHGVGNAITAIKTYARRADAVQISFTSPRRAWSRIARREGFKNIDNFFYRMLY